MIQVITKSMFKDAFRNLRPDNFSNQGLDALYEYLTDLEQDTTDQIELDVIALCCDYVETHINDILDEYDFESLDELKDHTLVLEIDENRVIYQVF